MQMGLLYRPPRQTSIDGQRAFVKNRFANQIGERNLRGWDQAQAAASQCVAHLSYHRLRLDLFSRSLGARWLGIA